ncbi:MAG: hypothetical protein NZ927_05825 [Candidatus Calescibacterium sp.]|nr:hypothetical protein [Candidatus Calescibacterium sp.]MCX7734585.1 hypothetical protein [bacterium]MDW8086511.1 hypothetical protein [Candidatus Calescibacterium sp.]
MIEINEVRNIYDLYKFIDFEIKLKSKDKNFIAPLIIERFLYIKKNPFFEHGKAKFFLAKKGKEVVGRISAHVDYLQLERGRIGFFGFFDFIDSKDVAQVLLKTAEDFARSEGLEKIRGPFSFNINGECGVLVEGFDFPPYIMMTHNPKYYDDIIKSCGFQKVKDLFAWRVTKKITDQKASSLLRSIWKSSQERFKVVEITKENLRQSVKEAIEIFNDAWSDNWGFVPITEKEGENLADSLKLVLDPKIAFFAQADGKNQAVCIAVPNINEALKNLSGGKRLYDYIKLFLRLRKIRSIRVMILGVRKSARSKYPYLPFFLVGEVIKRGAERGYQEAEMSWTLEDNERINKIIHITGAERYKVYRIYEKEL